MQSESDELNMSSTAAVNGAIDLTRGATNHRHNQNHYPGAASSKSSNINRHNK